jgi:hypothetical protein
MSEFIPSKTAEESQEDAAEIQAAKDREAQIAADKPPHHE